MVANHSPHKWAWFSGDPADYPQRLGGKRIRAAAGVGTHVELQADEMTLVIGTPIHFHPAGEQPPAKHQLLLGFDDGSAISCTVQMWGALFCFPQGERGGLPDYWIAKEKPSPLTDAFDRAYFDHLFDAGTPELSAKAFLATEQRVSGLGNGVLQDILWTARIHPRRKMGT